MKLFPIIRKLFLIFAEVMSCRHNTKTNKFKDIVSRAATSKAISFFIMENQEEIWKDIIDYKGTYQASDLGNIKSLSRVVLKKGKYPFICKEKILKTTTNRGYLRVDLCKDGIRNTKQVHQLVAMAFLNHIPCGHKLVVNHINHNRKDNRVCNLEIITQRENANRKHLKSISDYVGVCWHKSLQKWGVKIMVDKKRKHLGYFTNELDASMCYENYLKDYIYEKINSKN